MNVGCPSCNTVYRIDPAKVPEAGVRARCTVCSRVIPVSRNDEAASSAPTAVTAGTQPVPEPRDPRRSQEEIAATLGEAFIAPPEESGRADSETPVTEAAPPPVPAAPPAQPESPGLAREPSGPDSQPAGPTAVPAGPPPTPVSEAPSPVGRKGGLRVTRPFSRPGPGHTPSPSQRGQGPQRPVAPVFRPTPGRPLQPASAPPAEPRVTATAPTVVEPAMPVEPATPSPPTAPAAVTEAAVPAMPVEPAAPSPSAAPPTVTEAAVPAMPVEPAAPSPSTAPPAVTEAAAPAVPVEPAVPSPPKAPPAVTETAAPAMPVEPAAPSPPAAPPAPSKPVINPFLSRDPKLKARRLARALISDMIVYQPQKRQEALESGNLKEVFEGEIKKSWEEYVGQVGEEIANATPYFTEALNEILAGGQPVF